MSTPNAKSLKKTLFSPCRRMGLSRKIKTPSVGTPASAKVPETSENCNSVKTPQKSTETPKRTLETPVIRRAIESNKRAKGSDSGLVKTPSVEPPARKSETNCDKPVLTKVSVVETPNRCKTNSISKSRNKSPAVKKLEPKKEIVMKECTVQLNTNSKPALCVANLKLPSPKKTVETKKSGRENRKPVKRLSMKKRVSTDSEDLSDDNFTISKLSGPNSQVEVIEVGAKSDDAVIAKPKRRRAVLSSSEDEDFVSSQSSNKEEDLQAKVEQLSEEIKQKTLRLHDLQRASVYRNLHNVKELREITLTWKNGCESALRMLHKNLQNHGPINMPALLEKLNVPSDFLSYNTDEDVFF